MGCSSCKSGGCSSTGCGRGGACSTGGCNKLNSFDWLGNMLTPEKTEADNIYEVRFKNTRKDFFRNVHGLRLYTGDHVVVESDRGYDVGEIALGGVMAELQMRKKGYKKPGQALKIFRKAHEDDLALLRKARAREQSTLVRTREIILEQRMEMKLSDVEYQGDNTKAIFYYISDHRVDFRELIKTLAREFKIRVEMRQISHRHEAGLVGGLGVCGRELCCATWLTDFKTVSTSAARYQNLSLNPMKISGMCGRLKCCLNYELDTYIDALTDFPQVESVDTARGRAFVQKTDIFKGKLWFSYPQESTWYPLTVAEVKAVIAQNKAGEKPDPFTGKPAPGVESGPSGPSMDFVDVVGSHLPEVERRKKKKKKKPANRARPGEPSVQKPTTEPARQQPPSGEQQPKREARTPRDGQQGQQRNRRNSRNKRRPNQPGAPNPPTHTE